MHRVTKARAHAAKAGRLGVRALFLLSAAPLLSASPMVAPDRVRVTGGVVQGHALDDVLSFKGIPYAAPPVGPLRWRAPQAVRPWNGVLDARNYASDCMQLPDKTYSNVGIPPIRTEPSEDCLYINVLRPKQAFPGPLPVMVWFHGGGHSTGGASPNLFQGEGLARQGTVFVSFNYRLGRLGFFGHPALTREHPEEPKANYGLMDQIAALKWVQQNAASFGGDPNNVTIFGESAGGSSALAMIVSPLARGLFQKAIIQSGPSHGLTKRFLSTDQPGRLSLEKLGIAFAASKGINGTDAAALDGLRKLPASAFTDLSTGLPDTVDQSRTWWGGMTMDGKLLPFSDGDYFKQGRFAKIPIIVGANSDDITPSSGALDDRPVEHTIARFGSLAPDALRVYDPDGKRDAGTIRRRVSADDHLVEPARFLAQQFVDRGMPVYRYYFAYVGEAMRGRWTFGAPHGSEIAYAFDNLRLNYGPAASDRDQSVATIMNRYWVNFAKTGDPNMPGLPKWPRYLRSSDIVMEFHDDGVVSANPDPLRARLDLAERVSERQRDPQAAERDKALPQWPRYEPVRADKPAP